MKNAGDRNLAYYLSMKYPVQIVECDEGGYFVKIPELPGCLSQGETVKEALRNIKEAKELWLESAFEDKAEIPLPADEREYSGKFIVRLPATLHERMALSAEREGVSLNQYVALVLAENSALRNVEKKIDTVCTSFDKLKQGLGEMPWDYRWKLASKLDERPVFGSRSAEPVSEYQELSERSKTA